MAPDEENAPWPIPTSASFRLLVWPRYERSGELEQLFREFGGVAARHRKRLALCLRHDPERDPPRPQAERALRRARRRALGWGSRVSWCFVDGTLPERELPRLGRAVQAAAALPSSNEPERTAFYLGAGVDLLAGGAELEAALEAQLRPPPGSWEVYGEDRQVTVEVNGRRMELRYPHTPGILPYLRSVLAGREYPLFARGDYQAAVVVDIGAHVGCAAMYFATAYPGAAVYSFEPAQRSFRLLEQNCRPLHNVRCHPYGLFDREASADLHYGATSSMQNSLAAGPDTRAEGERVALRRASSELRRLGIEAISILKLDTEGCELPILRELAGWLPRTDVLHLEYHSEEDRLALEELLRPHFQLWRAGAEHVHRGSNAYLSRALVERYPALSQPRLRAPSLS